ncbi:MAG: dihydroneopterin aldolase [Gammaproteobacteria bacterium]
MDTLFIFGLKLKTRIGVYDWEHDAPQPVLFDLELQTNLQKAAQSCQLQDTIDYAALADRLQEFTLEKHFELIETLAEEMAAFILETYPVAHLRLKINKIEAIKNAAGVGLIIERSR